MNYRVLHDRGEIERMLRRDLPLHIYELGDLDDRQWPYTMWFGPGEGSGSSTGWSPTGGNSAAAGCPAVGGNSAAHPNATHHPDPIALLYVGLKTPTLIALAANPDSTKELIAELRPILPVFFYAQLSETVAEALQPDFQLTSLGIHHKMLLDPARLQDYESRSKSNPTAEAAGEVLRLDRSDREELCEFYAEAYPENWFDPRMLETGKFFGAREDGRLAGVAGVHVYAPRYRVAAVGNVATLPALRGRGYGTRVTARLCRDLIDEGLTVGLNLKGDNTPALQSYGNLGFTVVADYEEYAVGRRSADTA